MVWGSRCIWQRAEIVIERMIFLHHHDDVIDARQPGRAGLGDGVPDPPPPPPQPPNIRTSNVRETEPLAERRLTVGLEKFTMTTERAKDVPVCARDHSGWSLRLKAFFPETCQGRTSPAFCYRNSFPDNAPWKILSDGPFASSGQLHRRRCAY